MPAVQDRFPRNDIISLVGESPRFDLAESVGPSLRVEDLWQPEMASLALGYGSAAGDPTLREALAQAHGVTRDDVVVTVGGMHALFLLAFVLCQPGDEAIVAGPVFPSARNALVSVGAEVRTLPFRFDHGYQPDLGELRRLLSPRTRLVSLATPQNPSGVAIPSATLREIVALIQQAAPQAWLVLDETYREASYGDDPIAPTGTPLGPRVVTVASLSKCHGAAGLRIGWAITPDASLHEQLLRAKFGTVISCSPLDEALALRALHLRDRILGERQQRLADNLAATAGWVQAESAQLDWVRPDAGALCCVRLKPTVFGDTAVQRFYAGLQAEDTRVAPGPWFGEPDRVFRLGFGLLANPELREALARVSAALRRAAA